MFQTGQQLLPFVVLLVCEANVKRFISESARSNVHIVHRDATSVGCPLAFSGIARLPCFSTSRSNSRSDERDDDNDDDNDDSHDRDHDDEDSEDVFWEHAGGIVVICLLGLVGAGLFSLCAWITCSLHSRCTKRGVKSVLVAPGKVVQNSLPPEWSRSLTIQPELTCGFGLMSEGFFSLSNVQVLRQRPGTDTTDGAKWGAPLTTGKHVFEIIWPWGCRGYHATVGVATSGAPIKAKGGTSLVGGNTHTWGLDIVKRRALHSNKTLCSCPTDGSYVPDRFMMYVDVDEGTVGFGSDVTFWGNVITGLPRGQPLFPMVGAGKWEANIQFFYRGSAGTSGFDPYTGSSPTYALPPLRGQPPPTYTDVFTVPVDEPAHGDSDSKPDRPRSAWEPMPPPSPFPTAPEHAPPPYASPTPPQN
ncbi:spry domain-containing socs box protein 1 [Plakobranchus ocellatus]|uniref:Spry domain-containing socs box protein 1 n=1 Tax=Plakobranchus ocellatus TaxID=259542 RepID=A0AAV3ZIB9_9GAST|nr:spry domain-containing socs box protein 1 [Plakobranchus ocellatus]